MTLYDPTKPPMIDFETTLVAFVRVNRLEDSPCTTKLLKFAKCAQPDIYPGTSLTTIEGLSADFVTSQATSEDIYVGVEIRDSLTDGYVGLHYLTETATITMSSRTEGAHVWYKIDRSGNAGLQVCHI